MSFDPKLDKQPPTLPKLLRPAPLDFADFESSLASWQTWNGVDGARLTLDSTEPGSGRRCLLAENRRAGGNLGTLARSGSLDVRRYPVLGFDYRAEPRTYVNLLIFTARGRHEVELTDPSGGAESLGRVSGARADGRWHHAEIDLEEALSRRKMRIVRQLVLADLGPGSSTTSSIFRIDNWGFMPAVNGSAPVAFAWTAGDESGVSGYSAVLDREKKTEPEEKISTQKGELVMPGGLAEGTWYLHVRARDGAGNWGPSAHWRFKIKRHDDRTAPEVVSVSPAGGEAACPGSIEIQFKEDGSGLSAHDIELTVGGKTYRPGDEGMSFYPSDRSLKLDMVDFDGRLRAAPGEVECSVRAADYAGNLMEKSFTWKWKLDPAADAEPPAAPRVVYLPSDRLFFQDFETGQAPFANWRRGLAYRSRARRPGEGGMGRWHLSTAGRRINDHNNEIQLWPHSFDPERYSHLAFDYRADDRTSFNFMLQIGNKHYTMDFCGSGAGWRSRLGSLYAGRTDGRWHRAEIDLRELRRKLPGAAGGRAPLIQKMLTSSASRYGADLDNFVLASPYGRDPEFIWEAPRAASGINGYSYVLDEKPDTVPPEKSSGTSTRAAFKDVEPGGHWFHLRARNGAGRWGPAKHLKFTIEPEKG